MLLQELLFPNYDTCAIYNMYFRMGWPDIAGVYDVIKSPKNVVRQESYTPGRGYYDPEARAVHLDAWQWLLFDTYFNAFSIGKWNRYTRLSNLKLRLDLEGSFHVSLQNKFFMNKKPSENTFLERVCHAQTRTTFEFDIPCAAFERGVICFRLNALEGEKHVYYGGGYYTDVDEATLNPVNIAIDICTFRRERFVERNIGLLNREIIESPDHPLHGHLDVFIADNGRTLDADRLRSDRVHIYPNRNVGGAGGFARGMIEILDMSPQRPFTHALVMDDDVLIHVDGLLRNYRLLQFMKPEYAGKTVAGAMLRLDNRNVQHECCGWWDGSMVHSCKSNLTLTELDEMLINENEDLPGYNAWWYSCIPMSKISNENLPMPLFIRYDDVEFGLRTGSDIISIGGICLWHEPFEYKYSSAMEYYQMRNALIVDALHRPDFGAKAAVKFLRYMVKRNLGRYRYINCELIFRAVEDFCKGPDFLLNADGEALHKQILADAEHYLPLNQLSVQFDEETYLKSLRQERLYKKLIRFGTLNRHLMPRRGTGVVDAVLNGAKDYAGKRRVLNYDLGSGKGFVTEYSGKKLFNTMLKAAKMARLLRAGFYQASAAYRQAMPTLTSRAFWDRYLGLKD